MALLCISVCTILSIEVYSVLARLLLVCLTLIAICPICLTLRKLRTFPDLKHIVSKMERPFKGIYNE